MCYFIFRVRFLVAFLMSHEMLVCLTCVMTTHCAALLSVTAEGGNSGPIGLPCTVSIYCPILSQQED